VGAKTGNPYLVLDVLSAFHALYDVAAQGAVYRESFESHRQNSAVVREAAHGLAYFSSYETGMLRDLSRMIEDCAKHVSSAGAEEARMKCLCILLNQIKRSNRGTLPPVDDLQRIYERMRSAGEGGALTG